MRRIFHEPNSFPGLLGFSCMTSCCLLVKYPHGSLNPQRLLVPHSHLVGGWAYPSEKYEFVRWDYKIPNWMENLTYQVGRHSAKFSLFVWPPRLGATPWASAQRRSISCTQGRKNFQPRGGLGCGASDGKNHPRKIDRKMICKWDHYDFSIETHL